MEISSNNILARIKRKGTCVEVAPGSVDTLALANCLLALRVAGHAVVADEVFDSNKNSLGVRATHYLNCAKCMNDSVLGDNDEPHARKR